MWLGRQQPLSRTIEGMNDRELLRHIERLPNGRAGYKQLVRELGLGGGQERRELREQLGRLTGTRQLVQIDGEHWRIRTAEESSASRAGSRAERGARNGRAAAGGNSQRESGCGSARSASRRIWVCAARSATSWGEGRRSMRMCLFRRVKWAARCRATRCWWSWRRRALDNGDGRRAGRVVRILTRRNPTVVGIFHYSRRLEGETGRGGNIVVPFDERMTQPIVIPFGAELPPAEGEAKTPHRVLGREAQAARPSSAILKGWSSMWRSPTGRRRCGRREGG